MKKKNFIGTLQDDPGPMNPREEENIGTMICSHRRYTLGDIQSKHPCNVGYYQMPEENLLFWIFVEFIEKHPNKPDFFSHYWEEDGRLYLQGQSSAAPISMSTQLIDAINQWKAQNLAILPLYLYDHSSLALSTTPFSCPWDSGQIGYIYAEKRGYDGNFVIDKVTKFLKAEVETYNSYLSGDCWGKVLYRVDDEMFKPPKDPVQMVNNGAFTLYIVDELDIEERYNDTEQLESCWGYYGQEQARQAAISEFPTDCLSDCLPGYFQHYLIGQEKTIHNGIINKTSMGTRKVSREEALEFLSAVRAETLSKITIEGCE